MNGETPSVPTSAPAGKHRHRGRSGLAIGLVLIFVGVVFLLDNLRIVHSHLFNDAWPLILVVIGAVRMFDRGSGFWLVAIGLWLFINENELWGFRYDDSWPLLVVAVGLSMVWKALRGKTTPPASGETR